LSSSAVDNLVWSGDEKGENGTLVINLSPNGSSSSVAHAAGEVARIGKQIKKAFRF
jgi:hypothetical protein